MEAKGYEQLNVWQKAMDLTVEIYSLTKHFPREELYGITNQMRRAAVSIPSNIAEGHSRNSQKEFLKFLCIAKGSNAELFTQLLICERIGYISSSNIKPIKQLSQEIARMLTSLITRIEASIN
ncbi:MAG: four helix bundle protein [Clostridia bacterium]|nr:four helix bundle protein [Clostridia bacterium]